jgi:dihydropteroate synthase
MRPPVRVLLRSDRDWIREIERVGADPVTWDRLRRKCRVIAFRAGPLPPPAASIVKQCMLSGGGDAIVARDVITCGCESTEALLLGTEKQFMAACASMENQPFGVAELGARLRAGLARPALPASLEVGGRELSYENGPLVMGILNVTPDSFSDGGAWMDPGAALDHALRMESDGAAIIDVGGESTRPGSKPVPEEEQLSRVIPVIRAIRSESAVAVSVDTTSSTVAAAALDAGASMVNDVSALSDPDMAGTVASSGVPVVLMHMQGVPGTMQVDPSYGEVFTEVYDYLEERVETAVEQGIPRERILVDPGIGFGKKLEHNIVLIKRLCGLRDTGCRVVLGHSRKSFLGMLTGEEAAAGRDCWTHVVSVLAAGCADVLRVHDVGGTVTSLRIAGLLGAGS